MANLEDIKKHPHLIAALSRGESVLFNGEQVLPDILPTREQALNDGANVGTLLAEKDAEIEALKAKLAGHDKKPDGKKPEDK